MLFYKLLTKCSNGASINATVLCGVVYNPLFIREGKEHICMKKVIIVAMMVTLFCFNSNSGVVPAFESQPEMELILAHKPPNPWAELDFFGKESTPDLVAGKGKSSVASKNGGKRSSLLHDAHWVTGKVTNKMGPLLVPVEKVLPFQERPYRVPVEPDAWSRFPGKRVEI